MAEPITIYKLIILYMLSQVDFPLGNTKISNFFLDKEYTTYFTIQQVLNDLLDSELIPNPHTITPITGSLHPDVKPWISLRIKFQKRSVRISASIFPRIRSR